MSSVAEKLAKKSSRRCNVAKQVRLKLVYVDFWSAVKLSFLIAVCLADRHHRRDVPHLHGAEPAPASSTQIDALLHAISPASSSELTTILSIGNVMGFAVVVAILNTVVVTALGAIFAVLYNLSVKVTGGLLVGFTNN